MNSVNEALLEMYYLRAFADIFESCYGKRILKIFKPSQQMESLVGFDQAWVKTTWAERDFYDYIKAGTTKKVNEDKFYIGYFMQFKVVEQLRRIRSGPNKVSVPSHFSVPYYRSELKTEPSKTQTISQHETLYNLRKNINNAYVYYICPMLFDSSEIYNYPDLDKVQVIDIKNAPDPTSWKSGERHFIMFQDENGSDMHWCSDPIKGKSLNFKEWINGDSIPKKLTNLEILRLITDIKEQIKKLNKENINEEKQEKNNLPPNFTVIEFENLVE